MKTIISSFFLGFIVSCSSDKPLELVLLNNEVVCVENIEFDVNTINENNYINNKTYDSISINVLNYKLTNNSEKKYFLILNNENLDVMEDNFILQKLVKNRVGSVSGLSFNLYKNDSIIYGRTSLLTGGYDNEKEYLKSKNYVKRFNDSVFLRNTKNMKLYKTHEPSVMDREVLKNAVIIYPGETKYFTSIVNLPLRTDGINWISNIAGSKPNFASLSFVNIGEFTKKHLSENQRREIQENGYEIFDGIIHSNKVPVKMRILPQHY